MISPATHFSHKDKLDSQKSEIPQAFHWWLRTIGIAYTLFVVFSPIAAGAEELKPPYSLIVGKYTTEAALCSALLSYSEKISIEPTTSQCHIGYAESLTGITTPDWKSLDPIANLAQVKRLFVWSLIHGNQIPDSRQLLEAIQKKGVLSDQEIDRLWSEYSGDMMELIWDSKYELYSADISLPSGAQIYRAYKFTKLDPISEKQPFRWNASVCSKGSESAAQHSVFFDLPLTDPKFGMLNHSSATARDIFSWKNRTYLATIMRPGLYLSELVTVKSGNLIQAKTVCTIEPKWGQQ